MAALLRSQGLVKTWLCQQRASRRTAMDQYVGLDVSLKETSIFMRRNRKRIWRGKCQSRPKAVTEAIRKHAPDAVLVVFETGPLAIRKRQCLLNHRMRRLCNLHMSSGFAQSINLIDRQCRTIRAFARLPDPAQRFPNHLRRRITRRDPAERRLSKRRTRHGNRKRIILPPQPSRQTVHLFLP